MVHQEMYKHHRRYKKKLKPKKVTVMAKKVDNTKIPRVLENDFDPRTPNQDNYVRTMVENDVTFCYGPAGSGKTCCAVGLACEYLLDETVSRIIITRPMVQCGRNGGGLGFLPGDVKEKFLPFMSPVIEEIEYFLGIEQTKRLIASGEIQIIPLELVKGKNFKNCFMICDEAENCEWEQLKTFMTRICEGTKCVFSGDIRQADVNKDNCAFKNIMQKLEGVRGVGQCELGIEDIQRSGVVGRILARLDG